MKILLAVDGSKHSLAAVQALIRHADWYRERPSVEVVTVHLPVPSFHNMSVVISKPQIERYYREEGELRMAEAGQKLAAAGIPCTQRVLVGPVAERIIEHAAQTRCDLICMGSRGLGNIGRALLGSVATKVLHLAKVPVLLANERSKS